jgi:hypothetical protein
MKLGIVSTAEQSLRQTNVTHLDSVLKSQILIFSQKQSKIIMLTDMLN